MENNKSLCNITFAFLYSLIVIISGFVSQYFFVNNLGLEVLGLSGVLNNIISALTLFELGFATALIFYLYKPIKSKSYQLIVDIMNYFKNRYMWISLIILICSFLLMPFLSLIIGYESFDFNINIVYILFVSDALLTYSLTYRRTLVIAYQKSYIINIIKILFVILLNVLQITFLIITSNYIHYLLIKILCKILEGLAIYIYITKKFVKLRNLKPKKLDESLVEEINKKVKSVAFHKIGGFIVLNTDNLIISYFLGIAVVGLYSNYYLMITAIVLIFVQIYTSITPFIANLSIETNKQNLFSIYKKIDFVNYLVITFIFVTLFSVVNTFVEIWIGKDYIFENAIVYVICLNLYFTLYRKPANLFKEANGIFNEDKYIPLIEAFLNIVISIVLVQKIGIIGVLMGTIVSNIFLILFSYPKFVYKAIFNKKKIDYIYGFIIKTVTSVILCLLNYKIVSLFVLENLYLQFLLILLISTLTCILFSICLYCKEKKTLNF